MIRVFLLALLALAALLMVVNRLPYQPQSPHGSGQQEIAGETVEQADDAAAREAEGPFAPWDGVWEGTITTRRLDGSIVESARVRQEHTTISPTEQNVDITDRARTGRSVIQRRVQRVTGDRIECRVTDPAGAVKVMTGALADGALLWHRRDGATGGEEVYREEVRRHLDGDLYAVEGFRRTPSGETLIVEGRLRRAESPPR